MLYATGEGLDITLFTIMLFGIVLVWNDDSPPIIDLGLGTLLLFLV